MRGLPTASAGYPVGVMSCPSISTSGLPAMDLTMVSAMLIMVGLTGLDRRDLA